MTAYLVSTNNEVALDDIDGSLFEMIKALRIDAPEYSKIERNYYGTVYLSSIEQVRQMLSETVELRRRYFEHASRQLISQRKIRAKDARVRDQILAEMLSGDRLLQKLDKIIEVCEDAIASDGTLVYVGD